MDDEFINSYEHGTVISCHDGKSRRFYPRIFTYSADYPEKLVQPILTQPTTHLISRVLFTSIRNNGGCPCPRCLIPFERLQNIGEPRDRHQRITLQRVSDARYCKKISAARKWIYGAQNRTIKSKFVEELLKEESLVPTSVSAGSF